MLWGLQLIHGSGEIIRLAQLPNLAFESMEMGRGTVIFFIPLFVKAVPGLVQVQSHLTLCVYLSPLV